MKKRFVSNFVFAAMAVIFMAGTVFAEFNLRTSVDVSGKYEAGDVSADVDTSAALSGEYMRRAAGDYLRLGGGFEFSLPKTYKYQGKEMDEPFWFFPLYISVQSNPIKPAPELFFRLNLGYDVAYTDGNIEESEYIRTFAGGLYYAFVTGWEFPFGLFFDIKYSVHNGSVTFDHIHSSYSYKIDSVYTNFSVGIGYKFGRPRN
ncbi:MAG: hypothetical protein LBO62_05685 [Endomicrobium sp.]|nr:hypothetical protein [Endomicrobium sp.]